MSNIDSSKRSASWMFLAAICVVITCLCLAIWQYRRGVEKEALLATSDTAVLDINALPMVNNESLHGKAAMLEGRWVEGHWWLLDNQVVQSKSGFDLLLPFELSNHALIIVNVGFVPAQGLREAPSDLPSVASLTTTFTSILKTKDLKGFTLADEPDQNPTFPQLVQFIDLSFFERQLKRPILPMIAYASDQLNSNLTPHFQISTMPAQKHFAYALQWLLLGFAAFIVAFVALKSQQRSLIHEE